MIIEQRVKNLKWGIHQAETAAMAAEILGDQAELERAKAHIQKNLEALANLEKGGDPMDTEVEIISGN